MIRHHRRMLWFLVTSVALALGAIVTYGTRTVLGMTAVLGSTAVLLAVLAHLGILAAVVGPLLAWHRRSRR
jgi:hypothetical protein